MSGRSSIVIVSPALADANNGNWRTAERWARLLADRHRVRIVSRWPDGSAGRDGDDLMLALHARRSAASISAWAQRQPARGLAVVLTGTDLYRDLQEGANADALQSVRLATRLVVLQPLGIAALPDEVRAKCRVIYQSVSGRPALRKSGRRLIAVMVGHLRDVKSPGTLMDAARSLEPAAGIVIRHIGAAQEPGWAEQARTTEQLCRSYRWLGSVPHERTRDWIQHAHVLVHTSAMEGGAHVIMEAVCSGTPVLASRVSGNVGLLGEDYAGYFDHGDFAALADLLMLCRHDQLGGNENVRGPVLLDRLRAQCAERARLFTPATERKALHDLVAQLQEPE
jgi:putative glycosyltransferase (TIGR04348 family)